MDKKLSRRRGSHRSAEPERRLCSPLVLFIPCFHPICSSPCRPRPLFDSSSCWLSSSSLPAPYKPSTHPDWGAVQHLPRFFPPGGGAVVVPLRCRILLYPLSCCMLTVVCVPCLLLDGLVTRMDRRADGMRHCCAKYARPGGLHRLKGAESTGKL